jgi:hypothetical protein
MESIEKRTRLLTDTGMQTDSIGEHPGTLPDQADGASPPM